MIKLIVDGLEDRLYLGEVTNPAGVWIHFAFNVHGNAEGVSMQATAFVAGRDMGQEMGGFEGEFFEEFQDLTL